MSLFNDDNGQDGGGANQPGVKTKEEKRKAMLVLVLKLAAVIGGLVLLAKYLA